MGTRSMVNENTMETLQFIHPLRSQEFTFQLKKSASTRSKLTDMARKHLYEDYLFLQTEEQKHRVEELKAGIKINHRGKGGFDGKRLAAHLWWRLNLNSARIFHGQTREETYG